MFVLRLLRFVVSLAILASVAALALLFALQFPHPARWDTAAAVIDLRRVGGPLLSKLGAWAHTGSYTAPLLAAALLGIRKLVSVSIDGLIAWKRKADEERLLRPAPRPPTAPAVPPPAPRPAAPAPRPAPHVNAAPDPVSIPHAAPAPKAPPPAPEKAAVEKPAPEKPAPGKRPIDELATLDGQGAAASIVVSPLSTAPPERLGRYEILQELGRGAMGVVYKAWDPMLGRLVAIKSMHPAAQLLGPEASDGAARTFLERFRREAQSAALLTHPGIVGVFDFVQEEAGQLGLVMEFVEGKTLESFAEGGRMPLDQSLDLVIQVAEALDFAHARGIVHRDIKPANVLVTPDGKAKVSDFGLAKLEGSSLTRTGEILGTPAFMSPEQFLGTEVDARSDLFSLGCILYWLCAGEKPFAAPNITAIAFKVVKEPFAPVRSLKPDVPADIDAVLSRILAKAPADRYQSGALLVEDLKAIRSGQPIAGAPA